MAPAVSWKSRSCCRKRMACIRRKRSRKEVKGQTTSHTSLLCSPG